MAFKMMTVYRIKTFLALMSQISDCRNERAWQNDDVWHGEEALENVLHQDGKFFVDIDKFGHYVIDG